MAHDTAKLNRVQNRVGSRNGPEGTLPEARGNPPLTITREQPLQPLALLRVPLPGDCSRLLLGHGDGQGLAKLNRVAGPATGEGTFPRARNTLSPGDTGLAPAPEELEGKALRFGHWGGSSLCGRCGPGGPGGKPWHPIS